MIIAPEREGVQLAARPVSGFERLDQEMGGRVVVEVV